MLVNAMLVVVWAVTDSGFFWPIFPIVGLGHRPRRPRPSIYGDKPIAEDEVQREMKAPLDDPLGGPAVAPRYGSLLRKRVRGPSLGLPASPLGRVTLLDWEEVREEKGMRMRRIKVHLGAFAVVAALMLALAPVSFGKNSSVGTYGGAGGSVAGNVVSNTAGSEAAASPTASASSSSALPFTGFDVALLGGGGLLLVLGGFAMARMATRTRSEPADSGI